MAEITVSLSPFGQDTADELERLGFYVPREEQDVDPDLEDAEGDHPTCLVSLPKGWRHESSQVTGGHQVIRIYDQFGRLSVVDDLDGGGVTILDKRQKPAVRR